MLLDIGHFPRSTWTSNPIFIPVLNTRRILRTNINKINNFKPTATPNNDRHYNQYSQQELIRIPPIQRQPWISPVPIATTASNDHQNYPIVAIYSQIRHQVRKTQKNSYPNRDFRKGSYPHEQAAANQNDHCPK